MGSNYPNFAQGFAVRSLPMAQTNPGRIFWVSNSSVVYDRTRVGSDNSRGTFDQPFATINYAVTQAYANRGDIIMVKPGHAETISNATTLVLNVAGLAIVGLGMGSNRPTLTFGAAAANIPVTAANVTISNILHKANFADVVSAYTATGTTTPTDLTIDNCEFRDGSSVLNFIKTVTGNATANSMDGFTYSNNQVYGLGTTAATQAVIMAAAHSRQQYLDNKIVYPALNDTATLVAFGANAQSNLTIARNRMVRPSTSSTGGLVFSGGSTTSTGYVYDNYMWHLDNTTALLFPTGTALGFQNNFGMITGAADKSGLINPAAV